MTVNAKMVAVGILVFYVLALIPSVYYMRFLIPATNTVFDPPHESIVHKTHLVTRKYFTRQVTHSPYYIYIATVNTSESVLGPELEEFSNYIETTFMMSQYASDIPSFFAYYALPAAAKSQVVGGEHDQFTVIRIDFRGSQKQVQDFLKFGDRTVFSTQFSKNPRYIVRTTSTQQIVDDLSDGILSDLVRNEAITLPIAFLATALCLRSVRALIIPIISVTVTVLITFGLCYAITFDETVSSFAPEVAATTIIALTIDYSIFIMSRFYDKNEEYKFKDVDDQSYHVVMATTRLSCYNVVLSGITIAVAFAALAFFPISFIATTGTCQAIAVIVTVAVSMTLTPSLLIVFYGFFSKRFLMDTAMTRAYSLWQSKNKDVGVVETAPLLHTNNSTEFDAFHERRRRDQSCSLWFKAANFCTRRPLLVIVVVLALGSPLMYMTSRMSVNFGIFNQVPRNSPHAETLRLIVDNVSPASFNVIIEMNQTGGVNTPQFFDLAYTLSQRIVDATQMSMKSMTSPAYAEGVKITNTTAWILLLCEDPQIDNDICGAYHFLWRNFVDVTNTTAKISINPPFNAYSSPARDVLNSIQSVIEDTDAGSYGCKFIGVQGSSASTWAIMNRVMELFPYQILGVVCATSVVVGIGFRSVMVPVRMLLTVAYTISISYGLGVVFFQYDWSHHIWHALSDVHYYTFLVPLLSFSLLAAVTLDYDIFVLSRIVEFKEMGFETNAATVKGIWKTGKVVSYCGVTMAFVFAGFIFSNTAMLNEFGFVATVAVLLDTFIVRPLLLPSLLVICGRFVWWPRKFIHAEGRGVEDMIEDVHWEAPSPGLSQPTF